MYECPLGEHEVELPVEPAPSLTDSGGVTEETAGPLYGGHGSSLEVVGLPVVDPYLESGGAPLHELGGPLLLDGGSGGVDVLGEDVSPEEEAACHVLPLGHVALDHLAAPVEACGGDLLDAEGLPLCAGLAEQGGVGGEGVVDAGVGDEVGLELVEVHVEAAGEAEGGGDAADDLRDGGVEVGVGGGLYAEVLADVVDGLVVHQEGAVRVVEGGVRGEDGVVGLHHAGGQHGGRVHRELQPALFAELRLQRLHQQGAEAGARAPPEGVVQQEALQPLAPVGQLPDLVEHRLQQLLPRGVVAPRIVVRGVLLPVQHLLGVVQARKLRGPHLVDHVRLQVH